MAGSRSCCHYDEHQHFLLAVQVLWGLAAFRAKKDPVPGPCGQPPGRDPEDVLAAVGTDEAAPGVRRSEAGPAVSLLAEGR